MVYIELTVPCARSATNAATSRADAGSHRPGREADVPASQSCQLVPPMVSNTNTRLSAQRSRGLVERRVHESDWDTGSCVLNWKPQIAVVGEDHGRVYAAGEDVDQQVRSDVDVGSFLLTIGVRHHEHRVGKLRTCAVLNHDRPLRVDEPRHPGRAGRPDRHRRLLDACHVVAVLDEVDASGGPQCLQVDILIDVARRVRRLIDASRAVDHPIDRGASPVAARRNQGGDERNADLASANPACPGRRFSGHRSRD